MAEVLVIGGAGGVGSAVVDKLLERGREVAVTVLNRAEADAVAVRHGGRVPAEIVDLSDAEATCTKVAALIEANPGIAAVIVCAAIAPCGPAELVPFSAYLKAYQVNCIGAVAIYRAAMPALRRNAGRMIFLGSMAGRVSLPFLSAYVATKFALEGLCDAFRRESAHQGVKISLVQPGGIKTDLVQQQLQDVERDYRTLNDAERERYGYLYTGFTEVANDSLASTASTAAQVASVVMEAFEADQPASRYVAGEDARELLDSAAHMSDGDLDTLLAGMFARAS